MRILSLKLVVRWFGGKMLAELQANEHKSGWRNSSPKQLLARLKQETGELERALDRLDLIEDADEIISEAADVANFAMMIADIVEDRRS